MLKNKENEAAITSKLFYLFTLLLMLHHRQVMPPNHHKNIKTLFIWVPILVYIHTYMHTMLLYLRRTHYPSQRHFPDFFLHPSAGGSSSLHCEFCAFYSAYRQHRDVTIIPICPLYL